MELVLNFIVVLLIFFTLSFYQSSIYIWVAFFALELLYIDMYFISTTNSIVIWTCFLSISLILSIPMIRRSVLTRGLFNKFKKMLPRMSDTEKEALEAGDAWIEADFFKGEIDWQKIINLPSVELTKEEESFLNNQVNTLCSMLDDWEIVHENYDLSKETWDYLKKEKFFGMIIPKEYGGLGFSAYAHSCIVTKIASRSITAAVTVMVPNSLGPAELIMHYGTKEQQEYYLPRLSTGEEIPCFALTAPEAGSDAGSIVDYGVVCEQEFNGEKVLGIKLNWNKRYITLAPVATIIGLAFKLFDPDGLIGDKESLGITVCLIPSDLPNVHTGKRHFPLDLGFMNGPTRGHEVFVPMSYVIGGQSMLGQGWRMLMECLSIGRSISLPALSTGLGQMLFRTTSAYSKVRKQFKTSIGKFEGVEEALARIGAFTYLMEATRCFTISAIDQGYKPSIASAITKYHLTELGRKLVNDSMDIHGGRGIMLGKNNYAGRAYQAIPISITVEGANILTRNLIIFGQGLVRCHPYLLSHMQDLSKDTWSSVVSLDRNLFSHIGYSISKVTKAFIYGLSKGALVNVNGPKELRPYFKKLSWLSAAFAALVEISIAVYGGSLKRRERLSARLGDVLSYLYLASALIKYYTDNGNKEEARPYLLWCLNYCLSNIEKAFKAIFENYSGKIFKSLLKFLVFPRGLNFSYPIDKLDHAISENMQSFSELKESLAWLSYYEVTDTDVVGKMELALEKMLAVEGIEQKLAAAKRDKVIPRDISFELMLTMALQKNILTKKEADKMREFENIRLKAIAVDEFEAKILQQSPNS